MHRFADASSATKRSPFPSNAIGRFTRLNPGCVDGMPSTISSGALRGHERVAVKGEAVHARRRARIERPVVEANARAAVDRTEVLHLVRLVGRVEAERDDPCLAGVRVDGCGHIEVPVRAHRQVTDRPQLFGDHRRVKP